MKKQSSLWPDLLKPVVVLVSICLIAALLLAYVNSVTAPVIAENARIEAEKTRAAVLPGAKSFQKLDLTMEPFDIDSIYREEGGLGYVVTSSQKGYKGDVIVTVGLDPDGKIVGLSADVSTETSGVGTKAGENAYLNLFMGLTGNCDSVDTISNATYSSSAVKRGVQAVLEAFAGLINSPVEVGPASKQ